MICLATASQECLSFVMLFPTRLRIGLNGVALGFLMLVACPKAKEGADIEKPLDRGTKKTPKPDPDGKTEEPKRHRAVAVPCERESKKASFKYQPAPLGPPCKVHADCTEKKNGRCAATATCTYDSCYVDADCRKGDKTGGVCECGESGAAGHSCTPGNCSTDSDCGKNGWCSPTYGMDCGPFTGTVGWYCHTAKAGDGANWAA